MDTLRIIGLEAENTMRLRAVEVKPDRNLNVIGGNNGNGKTSLLDSIQWALGGKRGIATRPIRDGENRAVVRLDLGEEMAQYHVELILERIGDSNEYKQTLKIKDANGIGQSSPQKILDGVLSGLTFDPLAFCNMERKAQLETLKSVLGLDFTESDAKRKQAFESRTVVGREVKRLQGALAESTLDPSAPDEEVSIVDASEALNAANEAERKRNRLADEIRATKEIVAELQEQLAERIESLGKYEAAFSNLPEPANIEALQAAVRSVESTNAKVRGNKAHKKLAAQLAEAEAQQGELTKQIEEIDAAKTEAIASAQCPVEGLAFTDEGVTFNGIPFEQASGAERLRVSMAMAIAMNPKLRVCLIRDGSLLDENGIELVRDLAQKHDMQVFLERVGKGGECSLIIEDGGIAEK